MKAALLALFISAAAASAAGPEPIAYELDDLRPSGVSEYPAGTGTRLYLQFRNEDGSHYLVYDEAPALPSLKNIERLQLAMAHHDTECSLHVDCTTKAFCTDDCHHLYYEMTNAPSDPAYADRNRCRLISYSCEKASPRTISSPTAATPAPATNPGAPPMANAAATEALAAAPAAAPAESAGASMPEEP